MSGHHGHDHSHAVVTEGNARKLTIALIPTRHFNDWVAGLITQSLALLSDAAHMFIDAVHWQLRWRRPNCQTPSRQ